MSSYSKENPIILDSLGRERIANQLLSILENNINDLSKLSCLDIACSSGVITHILSRSFKHTVGIDHDTDAIKIAQKKFSSSNLKFILMDATHLSFPNSSFDVVVCNQVYEFVADQQKLASEIFRVLTPSGVCLLGARNKFTFFESQTGIPLVHLFPFFKKFYYPARYLSWWSLRRVFSQFRVDDLTPKILGRPSFYKFTHLQKHSVICFLISLLPTFLIQALSPNFVWLLRPNKV